MSRFVADFMGFENIFDGSLERCEGKIAFVRVGSSILRGIWCGPAGPQFGSPVYAAFRAQVVRLGLCESEDADTSNSFECRLSSRVYKGKYVDLFLNSDIGTIAARNWDLHQNVEPPKNAWWRETDCVVGPNE
jgi:ABC-type Fe3+/spermidine/putrescine transport system ATPase subunit